MIITKKTIDRRTVLRGVGAALALPMLDAMLPALTAAPAPTKRLGAIYVPNGMVMNQWTPATEGAGFEFTPILKPLEPFRDRLLVLSGLSSVPPPGTYGDHPRASTRFLTDVPPKPTRGAADLHAGISMDQIAARQFARETQLASLEIGLESSDSAGSCGSGFSCAYQNTISWSGPSTPLPMEHDPRVVFERMFGDSGSADPVVRRKIGRRDLTLLDSVGEKLRALQNGLGAGDRARLADYLDGVRDIERRIQTAEKQNAVELKSIEHPLGVPDNAEEHAKLMFDLFAVAYQTDLTRIVTFMIGREQTGRAYPELGIPDAHHAISHHENRPNRLSKLTTIQTYHAKLFSYFLEKLRSISDTSGSLLDNVALIYGAGMSDSDAHDPLNLPILLVGGGGGDIKGGRHIRFAKDTPLANLHLTMLDRLSVRIEKIGDSTGTLTEIT